MAARPPLAYLSEITPQPTLPAFTQYGDAVMGTPWLPPPRSPSGPGTSPQPKEPPPFRFSADNWRDSSTLRGSLADAAEKIGIKPEQAVKLFGAGPEYDRPALPLADVTPFLGTGLSIPELKQSLQEGDYGGAAINALGLGLSMLPFGGALSKALKGGKAPLAALAGGTAALASDEAEGAWKLPYLSTAKGGAPKELWHGVSQTKLSQPFHTFAPVHGPRDPAVEAALAKVRQLTPADLVDEYGIPLAGDRSLTGVPVLGVGGKMFKNPVDTSGGPYYALRPANPGAGWASMPGAATALQNRVDEIADKTGKAPLLIYSAMGPRSGDFNTMTSEAIREAIQNTDASAKDIRAFDKEMRRQLGKENFPGVKSLDDAWVGGAGEQRKAMVEEMALAKWQDKGFPSLGQLRHALTEPDLLHAPDMSTGYMILRSKPGEKVVRGANRHPTYASDIPATVVGQLEGPVPWDVTFREQAAKVAAREAELGKKLSTPQIQRGLQMGLPAQYFDDELVRSMEGYLARK